MSDDQSRKTFEAWWQRQLKVGHARIPEIWDAGYAAALEWRDSLAPKDEAVDDAVAEVRSYFGGGAYWDLGAGRIISALSTITAALRDGRKKVAELKKQIAIEQQNRKAWENANVALLNAELVDQQQALVEENAALRAQVAALRGERK